jgi:threonine dehydrogenase-like Zn-dependent dehydrogenase
MTTMKAVVFKGKGRIRVEEVPKPSAGAGEAVIRITATTSVARTCTSSAASTP